MCNVESFRYNVYVDQIQWIKEYKTFRKKENEATPISAALLDIGLNFAFISSLLKKGLASYANFNGL